MRKLAAIMFTDIVGYTALMGEDEAKALQLLEKNHNLLKPIIEEFRGDWLKEIGDGTLSCFASAVDAVNCALKVQQSLKDDTELTLRIGIHIGDVVFKGGDVFGDGVNVASRIEPLAEPGGICVSDRVYDDIQNKPDVATVFLGVKELKHVKRPIKVYALTGEGLPAPLPEKFAPAKGADATGIFSPARLVRYAIGVAVIAVVGYMIFVQRLEARLPVPIAVADFVNDTDDPALDGMSGMLATSLEQSRRLSVLSRSRLFDILRQMGRDDVEFIDEALGREIASQGHIEALATATIRKFDETYTIDLKVLDVERNVYLFASSEEGIGKGSIPAMLDRLSRNIRRELKESNRAILGNSVEITKVTTPNLEAYQHYFQGEELINKLKFTEAIEQFEKAIAIDTTFGLAYYRLAYAVSWSGESEWLAKETVDRAFALIDRIPEKERYLVRAEKVAIDDGMEAGLVVLREMERIYPDDKEMIYNIGDWSWHIGDNAAAEEYLKKVLVMDPTFQRALQHLTWTYRDLGQSDKMLAAAQRYVRAAGSGEAYALLASAYALTGQFEQGVESLRKAQELQPGSISIAGGIADLYMFQGQYEKAVGELKPFIAESQPTNIRLSGYLKIFRLYPYAGKYRDGLQLIDKYTELCWQLDDTASAISTILSKGIHLTRGW